MLGLIWEKYNTLSTITFLFLCTYGCYGKSQICLLWREWKHVCNIPFHG